MGTHLYSQVELTELIPNLKKVMSNLENQGFNARKCSASGRLIGAKDHASIQIAVAEVDEQGRITGSNITYAICGDLRRMGESDDALNRLCRESNIIPSDKFPAV